MRRLSLTHAPLPAAGYVLTLIGFVFLGCFTAALALGSNLAAWLGAAMIASYALAVLCFVLRARHIATADPSAPIVLGIDPLRGNTDRRAAERYLARYRSEPAPVTHTHAAANMAATERHLADAA